jgi:hypothetical protein
MAEGTARGFTLVWAALDAANLPASRCSTASRPLTVIGDHDAPTRRTGRRAGNEAAEACARRWHEARREVRIWLSENEGAAFNNYAGSVMRADTVLATALDRIPVYRPNGTDPAPAADLDVIAPIDWLALADALPPRREFIVENWLTPGHVP